MAEIPIYVKTVCKLGEGPATCSFLMMGGPSGWACAKAKGQGWVDMIQERRILGTIRAMGDNCEGKDLSLTETPTNETRQEKE